MPMFPFTKTFAGAATYEPLNDATTGQWMHRVTPYPCHVEILLNATIAAVQASLNFGSTTIIQKSPVSTGGVVGVLPARINTEPLDEKCPGNTEIFLRIDVPAAGTVNGVISITPL